MPSMSSTACVWGSTTCSTNASTAKATPPKPGPTPTTKLGVPTSPRSPHPSSSSCSLPVATAGFGSVRRVLAEPFQCRKTLNASVESGVSGRVALSPSCAAAVGTELAGGAADGPRATRKQPVVGVSLLRTGLLARPEQPVAGRQQSRRAVRGGGLQPAAHRAWPASGGGCTVEQYRVCAGRLHRAARASGRGLRLYRLPWRVQLGGARAARGHPWLCRAAPQRQWAAVPGLYVSARHGATGGGSAVYLAARTTQRRFTAAACAGGAGGIAGLATRRRRLFCRAA